MLRDRVLALPANVRGALWILLSALCFTAMSVLIRSMAAYPSPVQAMVGHLTILAVLAPLVLRNPRRVLVTRRMGINLLRAACSAGGVMLYYYAFTALPLAEANALSFTRALWIAPIAAIFLREHVGWNRWTALAVGFVGVLLVAQPQGHAPIGWPHAAALLSAMLLAGTATGVKALTRDLGPLSILAWAAILGGLFTAPFAIAVWRWPTLPDLAALMALGVLSLGAQLTYIRGMTVGDASAMAPIDYSRLIFAVLVGLWLYGEVPNWMTAAGMAVIVAATLLTLARRPSAAIPPARPPPKPQSGSPTAAQSEGR